MAKAVAAAISRMVFSNTTTSPLFLTKRLLSSSSILPRLLIHHPLRTPPIHPARFNSVRYAIIPPRVLDTLANRRFIFMESPFPGSEDANLQQLMDYYIQTLAKVVGSEEEAKMKIYRASYLGFGCEIDTKTLNKLEDLQGVRFVFPDCGFGKDRYDLEHWLVVMDSRVNEKFTIDCYIQTLAKFVGSEEEAKKKIYSVSCGNYFGFGCEIDMETVARIGGQFEVHCVFPDYAFHTDRFVDWGRMSIEYLLKKHKFDPDTGMAICDQDRLTGSDQPSLKRVQTRKYSKTKSGTSKKTWTISKIGPMSLG